VVEMTAQRKHKGGAMVSRSSATLNHKRAPSLPTVPTGLMPRLSALSPDGDTAATVLVDVRLDGQTEVRQRAPPGAPLAPLP
jgi:hypothetical protein